MIGDDRVKITEIELFSVPPRWLFVKLSTDEGVTGWGEPVVEGRAETVKAAVLEARDVLIGRDPDQIEDIWQTLYRGAFYRGGPILMSAIAGIDQALWDLKGQRYGLPIYQFLGGRAREKIRVYSWIGGDRPQDVGSQAREKQTQGFTAIKMNACEEMHYVDSHAKVDGVLERVGAVREACGKEFGIAVDFHGRCIGPWLKCWPVSSSPIICSLLRNRYCRKTWMP